MSATIDQTRLEAFLGTVANEVGAAMNTALVAIGDRLGLYRAMADSRPVSAAELAARTSTHERYVREWLNTQAASGFVRATGTSRWSIVQPNALTSPCASRATAKARGSCRHHVSTSAASRCAVTSATIAGQSRGRAGSTTWSATEAVKKKSRTSGSSTRYRRSAVARQRSAPARRTSSRSTRQAAAR